MNSGDTKIGSFAAAGRVYLLTIISLLGMDALVNAGVILRSIISNMELTARGVPRGSVVGG